MSVSDAILRPKGTQKKGQVRQGGYTQGHTPQSRRTDVSKGTSRIREQEPDPGPPHMCDPQMISGCTVLYIVALWRMRVHARQTVLEALVVATYQNVSAGRKFFPGCSTWISSSALSPTKHLQRGILSSRICLSSGNDAFHMSLPRDTTQNQSPPSRMLDCSNITPSPTPRISSTVPHHQASSSLFASETLRPSLVPRMMKELSSRRNRK